jgi:hypothetical protein
LKTLRYILCVGAAIFGAGQASTAQAAVTNASFAFCGDTCIFDPELTGKAGQDQHYIFSFTLPNGFEGGTGHGSQNVGGHSITIDGSNGKAPGTVFSTGPYQLGIGDAGVSVLGTPSVTNNGETITITPRNASADVPPGGTMEIYSFGGGVQKNSCTLGNAHRFSISTTANSAAETNTFTIAQGDASQVTATAGDDQSTGVGEKFATDLQVKVEDACGHDLSGKQVSVDVPDSGPSGSFATGTPTTDSNGLATLPDLTANTVAGNWEATASVAEGSNPQATFDLNNEPGAPASAELGLDPSTLTADGTSTSTATMTVFDEFDNPIPGLDTGDFSFSSSDAGHSFGAVSEGGSGMYSAALTASITPGDSTITGTFDDGVADLSDTATLHQDVDQVAPTATINIGPGKKLRERKALLYFSSDDDSAAFECQVDDGTFNPCSSPYTTPKLSYGNHTVSVRAKDAAQNASAVDSLTFRVVR